MWLLVSLSKYPSTHRDDRVKAATYTSLPLHTWHLQHVSNEEIASGGGHYTTKVEFTSRAARMIPSHPELAAPAMHYAPRR